MSYLSLVKVTRKGQVTIPKEIRDRLSIKEGDYLIVTVENEKIVFRKIEPPEPGEPVGKEKYERIIKELDELRSKWL